MSDLPLPYDGTPPPEENPWPAAGPSDPLDRALDDYEPAVPDHVKSLMGRMSKGKVYLLEESPAIIHTDGDERIRRDPLIAELATQLDVHDPTSWLLAVSAPAPSPIRPNTLFLRSDVIKYLSTSKVFSYATGLGANVLGIEWLNDTTLNLIFPTPAAALLSLTIIAKAGFDPSEGDDPLMERSAHSVPLSLLPQAPLDPLDSQAGTELLGNGEGTSSGNGTEGGSLQKRGRGTFSGDVAGRFDLPALATGDDAHEIEWNLAERIDPNARITVRFATEADASMRKEARDSEWYKRHGRGAGKEKANAPRSRPYGREEEPLSWQGRDSGEGRDFAKRIGKERRDPYSRPPRDRGGRRTAEDLDRELDGLSKRKNGGPDGDGMDVDMEMREQEQYRTKGRGRREARGVEDLDKELDDMFAARSAADTA